MNENDVSERKSRGQSKMTANNIKEYRRKQVWKENRREIITTWLSKWFIALQAALWTNNYVIIDGGEYEKKTECTKLKVAIGKNQALYGFGMEIGSV